MGGRGREEEPHTASVEIPIRVSLRQLYLGEVLDVSYARQVLCVEHSKCQKNCPDCQGPGVRVRTQQLAPGFVQQVQVYNIQLSFYFKKFFLNPFSNYSLLRLVMIVVLHVVNVGNLDANLAQKE